MKDYLHVLTIRLFGNDSREITYETAASKGVQLVFRNNRKNKN